VLVVKSHCGTTRPEYNPKTELSKPTEAKKAAIPVLFKKK